MESWVHVADAGIKVTTLQSIALGANLRLARALEEAKWRTSGLTVPFTFFAEDSATQVAMLEAATVLNDPTTIRQPTYSP
jgi:hypothetical protein